MCEYRLSLNGRHSRSVRSTKPLFYHMSWRLANTFNDILTEVGAKPHAKHVGCIRSLIRHVAGMRLGTLNSMTDTARSQIEEPEQSAPLKPYPHLWEAWYKHRTTSIRCIVLAPHSALSVHDPEQIAPCSSHEGLKLIDISSDSEGTNMSETSKAVGSIVSLIIQVRYTPHPLVPAIVASAILCVLSFK